MAWRRVAWGRIARKVTAQRVTAKGSIDGSRKSTSKDLLRRESLQGESSSQMRSLRGEPPAVRRKRGNTQVPGPEPSSGLGLSRRGGASHPVLLQSKRLKTNHVLQLSSFFNSSNGASATSSSTSSLHKLFDNYRGKCPNMPSVTRLAFGSMLCPVAD